MVFRITKVGIWLTIATLISAPSACTGQPLPPPADETTLPTASIPSSTPVTGPVQTPVPSFTFTCVPPVSSVMNWLRALGNKDLPTDDVVMVDIGEGNKPGSDWWVVAAQSYDPGPTNPFIVTWLTDSPSKGSTWISIGWFFPTRNAPDWSDVTWPADRLAKGQAAQTQAVACLR